MAECCKMSAALVADEKSYVLKIHGYSRAKGLLKTGEFMACTPLSVGGHSWVVRFYPNGRTKSHSDIISLYLHLESTDDEYAKAKFMLSVLDKNGQPMPAYSYDVPTCTFAMNDSEPAFLSRDLEGSVHMIDDCLTIRCDITVTKQTHIDQQFVEVPPSDLNRHLGDLLKNKDAADVTFQVGGQIFSAHTCVLAARSSVFKAELLGAMKENSDSPIEICDIEPDVFKSLLHFIYTDMFPPALKHASSTGGACGDLVMAGHLLVAADRYDIGRLKLICEEKLCNHIDSDMVATSLALAEQHGFRGLKEACLNFLSCSSNLKAMMASDGFEHLKSSCPSVLKELIARMLPAELMDLIVAIWQ